jgi:hypothetical protein
VKNIVISAGIIVVAVLAVLMVRVLFPPEAKAEVQAVPVQSPSSALTGKVVSVQEVPSNQPSPGLRRVTVKLESGETVRALAHPACVVFPGDVARLAKSGEGYIVSGTE